MIGFREADEHATQIELAPGVHVRVVTIPTLVILKLVAYRDRGRTDDLVDVLFILENYSRYELENRIFDELTDQLASGELPFEQAGSFLLGRDVAVQCSPSNRPKVGGILDDLLRDRDALARLVPPALDEETWEKRFASITELFERLKSGFSGAPMNKHRLPSTARCTHLAYNWTYFASRPCAANSGRAYEPE